MIGRAEKGVFGGEWCFAVIVRAAKGRGLALTSEGRLWGRQSTTLSNHDFFIEGKPSQNKCSFSWGKPY